MTPTGEPNPNPRLRVANIDVTGVAEALNDNSADIQWWYDPATGRVEPSIPDDLQLDHEHDDDTDRRSRGFVLIESPGSRPAYQDMADFTAAVGNSRVSELLTQALQGRGAFRRFRDTLDEFDDLRDRWLAYTSAVSERRAIDWLADEQLVAGDDTASERDARSNTMKAALAAVHDHHEHTVAETDIADRWSEINDLIDAGNAVIITRNEQAWATIAPVTQPGRKAISKT